MIVLSHGVFVMTPQLSAVVVIALAFNVDQMVFESVADSTILRMITLLLPPRSLHWLHMHTALRCRINCTENCLPAYCIDLFICDEWRSMCFMNAFAWISEQIAPALPIHLSASSACPLFAYSTRCMWHFLQWLYTCWLHKALARITQLSCICTDPQLSSFALIPELIHLHWLRHGLHQGHNWLQCITYSSHCWCVICHVIACISTAWKTLHSHWLHW